MALTGGPRAADNHTEESSLDAGAGLTLMASATIWSEGKEKVSSYCHLSQRGVHFASLGTSYTTSHSLMVDVHGMHGMDGGSGNHWALSYPRGS